MTIPAEPEGEGAPPLRWPEAVVLVVGAVALGVAVIATRWGVFTPDTRPDLYQQPGELLRSTVQAWVTGASGLGQGNFNAGAAPVAAVVWVIRAAGASPWLAVRLWRLALLLVGAWGIRRYLGALLGPRLTVQGRVLATVFWVANPYVIVAGSTTPILLPYVLLPWTMLAFLHATRQPRSWRWPALFALAFFAQTGLNAGVVPLFGLLALPAHVAHARWIEGRRWRDLARVVVRCGLGALVVSLYWLLPSVLASGTGAGIATGTEAPRDVARTSSYAETARLLGNWPLYGRAGDRLFLGDYTVYLTSAPVVVASFLIPVLVGLALWRSRARERLLVVGLLLVALPVMVGLFPPDDPPPAGRALGWLFDHVPASLAFRTTNKVGAVVTLAEAVALVVGWRAWQRRGATAGRARRWAAVSLAAVVAVAASAPLWNGGLYPLGYDIPRSWQQATAALDEVRPDQRVLVVPGGTGGNYRWGMRSPDDLFPSLLDRPVAVRSTVVGRGDPAGNFLSAFDGALAVGSLPAAGTSTEARYLGAGDVLVRNDLLTEEIAGPAPSRVVRQVAADDALIATGQYGQRGRDTVPGGSGPATRKERRTDPADAALRPLATYRVADPVEVVRVADAAGQVLLVGDGEGMVSATRAGLLAGTPPVRYVADLDQAGFAAAVDRGGRLVLTDSNRRRAWDINRVANATSPTLAADGDVDAGSGATTTLWPDRPDDQTVTVVTGGPTVDADPPGFGLQPFGRPSNALDGDPSTAWITGGFQTAVGATIRIHLPERRRIDQVGIQPLASEPSAIGAVRVRVGDKQVIEAVPADQGPFTVRLEPSVADEVEVTVVEQSSGNNPVGLAEITVGDAQVREVTRTPDTLSRLVSGADAPTRARVAELPLDVLFDRAQGSPGDGFDDEEAQLDRSFDLPDDRTYTFTGELAVRDTDPDTVAAARAGRRPCTTVVLLDGEPLAARITSTRAQLAAGRVLVAGCEPVALAAGRHQLRTIFGWRLDHVHLASPGGAGAAPAPTAEAAVAVDRRSATRIDLEVGASSAQHRWLRLGEAYDDRWRLSVDGRDAGPPVVVDGYSVGWLIDGAAHHLEVRFAPQQAVRVSFAVSALALVGVTAVAVLPAVDRPRRRSGPPPEDDPPAGAAP